MTATTSASASRLVSPPISPPMNAPANLPTLAITIRPSAISAKPGSLKIIRSADSPASWPVPSVSFTVPVCVDPSSTTWPLIESPP